MLATNHPTPNGHGHGHGQGAGGRTSHSSGSNPGTASGAAAAADSSANYEFLSVIGSGSFGRICKVRRLRDGMIMARKEIDYRRMKEKERRQLVQEVNLLRELHHPNIVRYYSRYVDRDSCVINILMEYCEAGDLARVIKEYRRAGSHLPEEKVWTFFAQLVAALNECHFAYCERKRAAAAAAAGIGGSGGGGDVGAVLHRDIKPDNVFLDADHNAKLGDFGLSTQCTQQDFARTFVGTPFYMSPELVRELAYNAKSDIWSLGCLIYELCALEPPFRGQTHRQLNDNILNVRYPDIPPMYSPALRSMIARMLQLRADDRPSAQELFADPQIQAALVAKQIKDAAASKEREVGAALAAVAQRETEVSRREADVGLREEAVRAREAAIGMREEQFAGEARRVEHEMEAVTHERARVEAVQAQLVQQQQHLAHVQAQLEAEIQAVRLREEAVQMAMAEARQAQEQVAAAAQAQAQTTAQAASARVGVTTPGMGMSAFAPLRNPTPSSFALFQQQRQQQQQQMPSTAPRPSSASWAQPSSRRAPSTTHRTSSASLSSRHSAASAPATTHSYPYSNRFTPQSRSQPVSTGTLPASVPKYRFSNPTFTSASSTHHTQHQQQQHTLWTQFRSAAPDADMTLDDPAAARGIGTDDVMQWGSPAATSSPRRPTLKRMPEDSPDAFAKAVQAEAKAARASPSSADGASSSTRHAMRAHPFHKPSRSPVAAQESNLVNGIADMALQTPAWRASPPAVTHHHHPPPASTPRSAWTQQQQPSRLAVLDSPMPIDSTMADATNVLGGRTPASAMRKTGPATWTLTNVQDTPTDTPTPVMRAANGLPAKMARQPSFAMRPSDAAGGGTGAGVATTAPSGGGGGGGGGEFKVPSMPASAMGRAAAAAAAARDARDEALSTPAGQVRPLRVGGGGASRPSNGAGVATLGARSRVSGSGGNRAGLVGLRT